MARKIIDIGIVGNDGTGDSIRDSFRKVNDNFRELYSSLGLGERLTFVGLEDTPETYIGQENSIVAVNNTETGLVFKQIVPGVGIQLDFTSNPAQIGISSVFSAVVGDPNPALGGDLNVRSGGITHKIYGMVGLDGVTPAQPTQEDEAVNKAYADSKISKAGVNAINPRTGLVDTTFGTMTGPLILSRNPIPDDDETYDGLIAATKRYVDSSAFGSNVNLYVATSGQDDRVGVAREIQGRALAYAYRTLEAALKRAEELVLEARKEIGPYKKVLTYNNGQGTCTLDFIDEAPASGSGFSGQVFMSIDQAEISVLGTNYRPGDILTIDTGTYIEPARFEILSITAAGGVATFRKLSSGVYSSLPGSTNVITSTDSDFGGLGGGLAVARFNLTYKVNNVEVLNNGSGYGLVSVRIVGGGGTGAFGTADVDPIGDPLAVPPRLPGSIASITITDQGTGFTSLPNVVVNLPRFLIKTEGYRTDFTGDVSTSTPAALRGRDIREGLYLRGENSGALAQILAHTGSLDSDGNEIFDVDIIYGNFQIDEPISYGDVTKQIQISILVESGIYEENLPLRVPQNVSIVGDEFRRCIIRPKPGPSSSPWAFINFRRDTVIDGMNIVNQLFGYHYLVDPDQPVYPIINNKGYYRSAAKLLELNRSFIQKEVVSWINDQIDNSVGIWAGFTYNQSLCERDIGLLLDSMIFDLKWGGSNRTVSAALKYYGSASGLIAITDQLSQTEEAIKRVNTIAQLVIRNVEVTDRYQQIINQIVDRAYVAEAGSGGTSFTINGATNANPVTISTTDAHGLTSGDQILISEVGGMTELNGNAFYVEVVNSTSFKLYYNSALTEKVNGVSYGTYTSGGYATNTGGVLGLLFNVVLDVINESGPGLGSVNTPKNNDEMDMFLCNDAIRFQAITMQGHGGFAMVLDPEGQILAKSPYAQECASFSKSIGRQTFAGGMYIDGFAGNLKFEILGKAELPVDGMIAGRSYTIKTVGTTNFTSLGAINNNVGTVFVKNSVVATGTGVVEDNSILRVGGLLRMPQLPASFIVSDTIYRINYVRDFTFNVAGSTATFVLDETTPWPFDIFSYDESICSRDVGLIVDGLGYDIVFGSNYNARKAGLTYRQANAQVVIDDQLELTIRSIEEAHSEVRAFLDGIPSSLPTVDSSESVITTIIRNGVTFAPSLVIPDPPGLSTNVSNAKSLLLSNVDFIKDETIGWIAAQVSGSIAPFSGLFTYNSDKCARDIQYIVEAVAYDLTYGGNTQTRDAALKYYDGVGSATTLQLAAGQEDETAAAIGYARYLAKQVVQNLAPTTTYSSTPRVTGSAATVAEANIIDTLMGAIEVTVVGGVGSAPALVPIDLTDYSYNTALLSAREILDDNKSQIQQTVIDFVNANANIYEVLMPGNRSMLGNDFTQINDMGYGIVVNNGGLCEAVSMFSYYCHISMYSLGGGQIRSVSSSSAHGTYALVAEGSDPLEVPTPVTLFYDLAQGAEVYNDGGLYTNSTGGLEIYVTNYTYPPLNNSEIEIDHGYAIYRYPVSSATTEGAPAGTSKLSLGSAEGAGVDGLFDAVPDGTKVTIRQNSQVVLTGDVVEVAVRPSTGLVLRESPNVYRILQFDNYTEPNGYEAFTISIGSPAVITKLNHGLQPDYQIALFTTGSLPTGVDTTTSYYVLADGFTPNSFRISATKRGTPITTSGTQSGVHTYLVDGLARTTLRENYNYIDMTVWPNQPYETSTTSVTVSVASPAVVTWNNHGLSANDVVRFETNGDLPSGLTLGHYFVLSTGLTLNEFRISETVGGPAVAVTGAGTGTLRVGKVVGNVGDTTFAIVPVGTDEAQRIINSKVIWIGEEYTVQSYQNETSTGQPYALITLSTPLIDSVVLYNSLPTLKGAVPKDEPGTLTIRISLTRVTGHDLLEIGTGSYADTNYPSEIYGAAVNPLNPSAETVERGVGRTFYVTTDQFGNFNVGPYFRVDQGTGRVTFSAAIALSNLDGIGFKRGVPIAEFSTDSSFSDNATDTVPTENATRIYLERRLGLTHSGNVVPDVNRIPSLTGGFMSLDGQLSMNGDMNLGDNKIINVADPADPKDAVNLQSLTLDNVQGLEIQDARAGDLLTFTGFGNESQNSRVVGDISFNIDSTAHTVDAQISPDSIVNNDINSSAAIAQSKLNLNAATTRANATGITQSDRGVASFDSASFDATSGWVTLKTNGILTTNLAQIATKTALGNSSLSTGNVTAVPFTTIVNDGGAIKKSQYSSGTGYLRRIGFSSTGDSDYAVVDESSSNTASTLVKRDSSGNFSANVINLNQLQVDSKLIIDTNADGLTGGYTQIYGFTGGNVGIYIGDGSSAGDKKSFYDNDSHRFRTYNGLANAPVQVGTLTADSISANGGVGASGTITGQWTMSTTSGLTFNTGTLSMGSGVLDATSGTLRSRTLTTGSTSTTGVITGDWSLATGSKLQATYADLAEYYEGDKDYEVGTVLVFGGEKEVTISNAKADHRVAGVVSNTAAYSMNSDCKGIKVLIALQGRVPCRVVGKIRKGDLLVTSNIAGVAVSAGGTAGVGTVIGKALENYESDHIGTIEVAVGRT